MAAPAQKLIPTTAPDALRNLPAWLCWRWMENPGSKPRKVPYYADGSLRTGVHGRPEDAAALVTFEQARQAALDRGMDGVGFATLRQFNITAMDFDACVTGGQVHPEVAALVAPTYAEISPSGTGVRAFFVGQFPRNRKSNAHAERFGAESFSHKGFVTFTGQDLFCGDTVAAITADLEAFVQRRFGADVLELAAPDAPPVGLRLGQLEEILAALDAPVDYEPWLQVGMALHHETRGSAEGLRLWDQYSMTAPAAYEGIDVVAAKWDSFGRGDGSAVTGRTLLRLAREAGVYISTSGLGFDDLDQQQHPEGLRFPVVPGDLFGNRPPMRWIMRNILPEAELAMLYGESTAGKSFMALDMALAVARGTPWRGHKVRQGRVVYLCAEGAFGFGLRLRAAGDVPGAAFGVMAATPSFMDAADVVDVIRAIQAGGPCALVVVDTMAQVSAGANENSGEDMSVVLRHCREIHKRTGALVLLVHHSGKDASKGARGHSSIKAACDAELEVTRDGDARQLRVTKLKDGQDGGVYGFGLHVVPLGVDDEGELITSCQVVEAAVIPEPSANAGGNGKWERLVGDVLAGIFETQTTVDQAELVREVLEADGDFGGKGRDRRPFQVKRAISALSKRGFFSLSGETLARNDQKPGV